MLTLTLDDLPVTAGLEHLVRFFILLFYFFLIFLIFLAKCRGGTMEGHAYSACRIP